MTRKPNSSDVARLRNRLLRKVGQYVLSVGVTCIKGIDSTAIHAGHVLSDIPFNLYEYKDPGNI